MSATLGDIAKQTKDHMHKAVDNTRRELATIRSGKATTSLLDTVRVEAYGNQVPLNQVASVAAPEPRLLTDWSASARKTARERLADPQTRKRLDKALKRWTNRTEPLIEAVRASERRESSAGADL